MSLTKIAMRAFTQNTGFHVITTIRPYIKGACSARNIFSGGLVLKYSRVD